MSRASFLRGGLFRLVLLKERIGLKDDMNVLDVGCGKGDHLNKLKAIDLLRVGLDLNSQYNR